MSEPWEGRSGAILNLLASPPGAGGYSRVDPTTTRFPQNKHLFSFPTKNYPYFTSTAKVADHLWLEVSWKIGKTFKQCLFLLDDSDATQDDQHLPWPICYSCRGERGRLTQIFFFFFNKYLSVGTIRCFFRQPPRIRVVTFFTLCRINFAPKKHLLITYILKWKNSEARF